MEKTSSQSESLRVKVWGCRGSMSVAGREFVKYGGNTTCYEVLSSCLPQKTALFVDSGTGFSRAGGSYLSRVSGGFQFIILQTHRHLDHTIGAVMFKPIHHPEARMTFIGPVDAAGRGPKDEIVNLFSDPRFPVDSESVLDRMIFKSLQKFESRILVIHPEGGWQILGLSDFRTIEQQGRQVKIGRRNYELRECLVVKMHRAHHGNTTCVSYRFEERPTGRVVVICTDHENPDEIPRSLLAHFRKADLLFIDTQYSQEQFKLMTAGFGHGTPRGAVRQALAANVGKAILIHHDPDSTDDYLENEILVRAQTEAGRFAESPEFRQQYGFTDSDAFRLLESSDGIQLGVDYETYTS